MRPLSLSLKRALAAVLVLAVLQGAAVLAYLSSRRGGPAVVEGADGEVTPIPEGRPVLLHFWATWCPPCREELPGLLAFGDRLRERGGPELWAVSLDREWGLVRDFFSGSLPAAVSLAQGDALTERFGVRTLPLTVLLAPDGTVLHRYEGQRNWDDPRLAAEVLTALTP